MATKNKGKIKIATLNGTFPYWEGKYVFILFFAFQYTLNSGLVKLGFEKNLT